MHESKRSGCIGIKGTHRKHQMNNHMECNECNNNPIEPVGKFSFGQIHSEENGHNCNTNFI